VTALAAVVFVAALTGLVVACWPAAGPPPNFGHVTSSRRRRPYRWKTALWTGLVAGGCGPTAAAQPPPVCFEDSGPVVCGPPPAAPGFASGWVACGDRMVPADPRVDMSNPLGGVIYRRMLEAMCSGLTR